MDLVRCKMILTVNRKVCSSVALCPACHQKMCLIPLQVMSCYSSKCMTQSPSQYHTAVIPMCQSHPKLVSVLHELLCLHLSLSLRPTVLPPCTPPCLPLLHAFLCSSLMIIALCKHLVFHCCFWFSCFFVAFPL